MFLWYDTSILSARHIFVLAGAGLLAWPGAPILPLKPAALIAPSPLTAQAAENTVSLRRAALPGPYPVEILKVLDGDTFEARVRVWFGHEITTLVRIRGIDAPELKGRCGDELRGAIASRDALIRLLASGQPRLHNVILDKYAGRVVASIRVESANAAADVAAVMIASGWARAYNGGKRDNWCPLPPVRG